MSERAHDTPMMAARETAQNNPMRPPETLPRTAGAALLAFARHPSPLLIATFALLLGGARLALGALGGGDALVALAVLAWFPFNEWLIHVFVLHYRPRRLAGRTLDFYLPKTHRRHHAEPWNPSWVFIPRHVHALVIPVIGVLVLLLWPWKALALSGITVYLLLGLHYEWVHFLAHIPWCPPLAYYQRRVREHRYHHFRNENYWWGVSMGLGDRVLGTAPKVEETPRSGSTAEILKR